MYMYVNPFPPSQTEKYVPREGMKLFIGRLGYLGDLKGNDTYRYLVR